jgi:hypothetical protein
VERIAGECIRLTRYAGRRLLRTLGQPVIHGRTFTMEDRGGSLRVAVVNRAPASLLWGSTDPIGHRLGIVYAKRSENDYVESDYAIVGIAGNVKFGTLRDDNRPVLYLSRIQNDGYLAGSIADSGRFRLIVRTTASDATMAAALARTVVRNGLSVASVEVTSNPIRFAVRASSEMDSRSHRSRASRNESTRC